jgi:hypothetical protein
MRPAGETAALALDFAQRQLDAVFSELPHQTSVAIATGLLLDL